MDAGVVEFDGSACDPAAQRIDITGTGVVIFDLSGGDFESEDGGELWFRLDLSAAQVLVEGSDGKDKVTLGTEGINLDGSADVEVTQLDDDPGMDFTDAGVTAVTVNGNEGSDTIFADGALSGEDFPTEIVLTINGGDDDPGNNDSEVDGNDILRGGAGDDTIDGNKGNDNIEGGSGDDELLGGPGGDTFDMDRNVDGNDAVDGGDGKDTVDYSGREEDVSVTMGETFGTGDDGEVVAGELDDIINSEVVFGGEGDDILDLSVYGDGDEASTTLMGNDGDDELTGGTGNDFLYGGDGEDVLNGEVASVTECPDPPSGQKVRCKDTLDGGRGDDEENGGAGADKFNQNKAGNGNDVLSGGPGAGVDTVQYKGRSDDLTVTVGAGANDGQSIETDDIMADVEKVVGGSGDDEMTASGGGSTLLGGGGEDELTGGGGEDTLKGGAGEDELSGGGADDKLYGGAASDTLDGDAGDDLLHGGRGRDVCADNQGNNTKKSCP